MNRKVMLVLVIVLVLVFGGTIILAEEEKAYPFGNEGIATAAFLQDGLGYSGSFTDNPLEDPLGFRGFGQGDNAAYPGSEWPDEVNMANTSDVLGGVYVEDTGELWMVCGTYLISFDTSTGSFSSYYLGDMDGVTDDPGNLLDQSLTDKFYGGTYDGEYVWFCPSRSNRLLRVNPLTGDAEAFKVLDDAGLLAEVEEKGAFFYGMIFDGEAIWIVPTRNYIVKLEPQANEPKLTAIPVTTNAIAGSNIATVATKFAGGTFDGRYIWMAPMGADCIARIDTTDDSLMHIPLSQVLGGSLSDYSSTEDYTTAIFDGDSGIYFIPYKAESILKISTGDSVINQSTVSTYPVLVTKNNLGNDYYSDALLTINSNTYAKFRSSTFDGRFIWLPPSWSADTFVRFDTQTGAYTAYNNYDAMPNVGMADVTSLGGVTSYYMGAFFDGSHVWFIPRASDRIVRLEPYSVIDGTVTNKRTGNPVSGVTVTITDKEDKSAVYYQLTTDSDGYYQGNIPAGLNYAVTVTLPESYYDVSPALTAEVTGIRTGETKTCDFELFPLPAISIEKTSETENETGKSAGTEADPVIIQRESTLTYIILVKNHGAADDPAAKVTITDTIPEGLTVDKTAVTTAGGTVNGQTVTWPEQIIAPGTKEYRIPVTVTGTTLFAEDFINKAACRIEERNEELVSNPTYHRCERDSVSFTITKKTGSPAAREEHFLFRIDYQPEEDEDITRTFYGTTIIPPGDDTGIQQFKKLPPGIYTVTEEESNWRYELASGTDQEQVLKLTKPGQQNSTILFQNNLAGKEWLEASSDIMNKMKNPEND